MSTVLAWHFVGPTLRDGRPIPPDGEWLTHDGPVEICTSGLHASRMILDALAYAPGATICRVECGEIVEEENDKLVCRRRRIIWWTNGEDVLRDFARRCAWSVVHLWEPPAVVLDYLRSGDDKLRRAARHSASDGAWDAARRAAWGAAWGAASDEAWSASLDAAWGAAWGAASDAAKRAASDSDEAWSAAWGAAMSAQNDWLTSMVESAHDGTYRRWTPEE